MSRADGLSSRLWTRDAGDETLTRRVSKRQGEGLDEERGLKSAGEDQGARILDVFSRSYSQLRTWVVLLGLLGSWGTGLAAAERMNVLWIVVDDLANCLGSAGHPLVQTPHLDRLAASGVRFDRAYCQIPLCNPSRASVLTGWRPDRTRVYDLDRHFRDDPVGRRVPAAEPGQRSRAGDAPPSTLDAPVEVTTLPQLFRQHGWRTVRVGKVFHADVPNDIGTDGLDDPPSWDEVHNPRGRDRLEEHLITNAEPHRPISAALSWLAADGTDEEQTDGLIATEAVRLLEQHREEAFFLGVGFFRPHTPYVAPRRYFELYPWESLRLPTAPAKDREDIPSAAFAHNCRVPNYGLDADVCRRALQGYYASVSFVDAQIGRILAALDRLDLSARTIVVVWSDHGYHLGEHQGVWQKRTLFEESARTPLIVRDPRAHGNGRACKRIVELVDLYPTLVDLCGLPSPPGLAGRSLRPLLDDPAAAWEGRAVTQILRPGEDQLILGRSLRTERWRYTEWNAGADGAELYDHAADPHEWHNLAESPEHQAVRAELRRILESLAEGLPPATPVNRLRL